MATAEDEAFMADLLGEVETNVVPSRPAAKKPIVKSETRRKVRILSPPPTKPDKDFDDARIEKGSLPQPGTVMNVAEDLLLGGDDDMPMSDPLPSSPIAKAVARKNTTPIKPENEDLEDDDMLAIAEATGNNEANPTSVNISGNRPPPKMKQPAYPTPTSSSPVRTMSDAIDASSWNSVNNKLNVLSSPAPDTHMFGKLRAQDAVEEDGSLRMFWLDYTEVNGSLCLFGKVKNKKTGRYVSAFVKIDNILRKLYFLPREYKQQRGHDTDEEVDMEDVYTEVDGLMSKLKVGMHKIKPSTRKYAFELPDVPREAEYLKLMYPYDKPALPMDAKGETFSRVFGTNTALFEQFVLWKHIMGPCWLKIEEADYSSINGASWCKFECQVTNPSLITLVPESENMESPPLTLMSLSFRTKMNVKENKQEILVASARVYENASLTDTTPPEKLPCKTFTIVRPSGNSYPLGFEAETRKHRGTFMLEKNEQFLLSKFMALFERTDPDILMGHQLQDVDFNILLSRLREKKTPGWHRVGRLKRSEWPKNFSRGGSFFAERQLVSGRLICDIANDMGKVSRRRLPSQ